MRPRVFEIAEAWAACLNPADCISTVVVDRLYPQRAFPATQGSTVRIKGIISCLHSAFFFFFFYHESRLSTLLKPWLFPEVCCLQRDIQVPGAHSHKTLLSYISRHKLQLSAQEDGFGSSGGGCSPSLWFLSFQLCPPRPHLLFPSSQAMLSSKLTHSLFR